MPLAIFFPPETGLVQGPLLRPLTTSDHGGLHQTSRHRLDLVLNSDETYANATFRRQTPGGFMLVSRRIRHALLAWKLPIAGPEDVSERRPRAKV